MPLSLFMELCAVPCGALSDLFKYGKPRGYLTDLIKSLICRTPGAHLSEIRSWCSLTSSRTRSDSMRTSFQPAKTDRWRIDADAEAARVIFGECLFAAAIP